MQPGKSSTFGFSPGVLNSVRPLSLEDAEALARAPHVLHVVPLVAGSASVEGRRPRAQRHRLRRRARLRQGVQVRRRGRHVSAARRARARAQRRRARREALRASSTAARTRSGDRIRVGGERYRVVGIMESKGDMVGIDLDDTVYIPAARGLELFNRQGLLEIDVLYAEDAPVDEVVAGIKRILVGSPRRRGLH